MKTTETASVRTALIEWLHYSPATGVFRWRKSPNNRSQQGTVAGGLAEGYLLISVRGQRFKAHRLAWLYVTGDWPQHQIDHINGVKDDNRFVNLRDVPHRINGQNIRNATRANLLGVKGVARQGNRYVARITADGKTRYLGIFGAPEQAHAAYLEAKRELHPGCTI